MLLIFVLSSFIPLFLSLSALSLPSSEVIDHLIFLSDKLFYTTKPSYNFGFLSRETGEFMTKQVLKPHESMLKIDQEYNKIVLRKSRNEALIFRLIELNVHQIHIEIKFQHQRLVDLVETDRKVYAITNKDLRIYDKDEKQMLESMNSIVSSCKKSERFLRVFPSQNQQNIRIRVVLLKNQEVCLRKIISKTKGYDQRCLFTVNSQIISVDKIEEGIFIHTERMNYVIWDNFQFYSFIGQISQIDSRNAIIPSLFKTFIFKIQRALDGIAIKGSTTEQQFWITQRQSKYLIQLNGRTVGQLEKEGIVTRVWISQKMEGVFNLILQYKDNSLHMFELSLQEEKIKKIWPNSEIIEQYSQEL